MAPDPKRLASKIDAYHVMSEEALSQEAIGALWLNKLARSQFLRTEVPAIPNPRKKARTADFLVKIHLDRHSAATGPASE
jgi:hypothetical protein